MRKVVIIAFVNNKGGVGKTRKAIQTANFLASLGFRVLVLDMDFNNSATYYYLSEELFKEAARRNIADALARETNDLKEYTLPTIREGVDIIASSRYLSDLRAVSEKRLSRMASALNGAYDFAIIDCQPAYDNLTLNAINASDVILTPVLKDLDSYNAAEFLRQKIAVDTDKSGSWYVTINGYNRQYECAAGGRQKEYIDVFTASFPCTPKEAWYPWTVDMNDLKDRKKRLSRIAERGVVYNEALYNAVEELAAFCGRPFYEGSDWPRGTGVA